MFAMMKQSDGLGVTPMELRQLQDVATNFGVPKAAVNGFGWMAAANAGPGTIATLLEQKAFLNGHREVDEDAALVHRQVCRHDIGPPQKNGRPPQHGSVLRVPRLSRDHRGTLTCQTWPGGIAAGGLYSNHSGVVQMIFGQRVRPVDVAEVLCIITNDGAPRYRRGCSQPRLRHIFTSKRGYPLTFERLPRRGKRSKVPVVVR
jgi:hypothetical protein